jgi:hypothetical protein
MRSDIESMLTMLGLEIVQSDHKSDYEKTGYIVVKNGDTFVKMTFYDDSYNDGYISDMRKVTPRPAQIVEYV